MTTLNKILFLGGLFLWLKKKKEERANSNSRFIDYGGGSSYYPDVEDYGGPSDYDFTGWRLPPLFYEGAESEWLKRGH